MTDAQKKARAEKARAARAAAAHKRSNELEKTQLAVIAEIWNRIEDDDRRKFTYIKKQIASGERTPEDVAFLRESRKIHLNKYHAHLGGSNEPGPDIESTD